MYLVERDGWRLAVDEHEDGTHVAEIDDGDDPSRAVPTWLDVVRDVTDDEEWTGAALARRGGQAAWSTR
jgi:CYTH domain-containing protein